jgi:hypothetical protein
MTFSPPRQLSPERRVQPVQYSAGPSTRSRSRSALPSTPSLNAQHGKRGARLFRLFYQVEIRRFAQKPKHRKSPAWRVERSPGRYDVIMAILP